MGTPGSARSERLEKNPQQVKFTPPPNDYERLTLTGLVSCILYPVVKTRNGGREFQPCRDFQITESGFGECTIVFQCPGNVQRVAKESPIEFRTALPPRSGNSMMTPT